jgi:microsomal dipeptidase-like Zn-dependent dipeptidase
LAHVTVWEGHLRSALERGLNLMVVSAVNFKPLCQTMPSGNRKPGMTCEDMDAVDLQIDKAWQFVAQRDWVDIALTPADARRIVAEGKLALVLAVEVTELFGEGDWRAQLDDYFDRGVRSIQWAHQLDNRFTGVAPHHWIFKFFQFLDRGTGFELDDEGRNVRGLTEEGVALARAMMDKGMILDVAHLSERAIMDLEPLVVERGHYPVNLSHGHFRTIMMDNKQDEEKTTPDWVVRLIRQTGGMVGLRSGPEQVKTYARSGVPNNCDGSSRSFMQAYTYGDLGLKVDLAFVSDFMGFIQQLRPRFGGNQETCAASGDNNRRDTQQAVQHRPTGTPLDVDGFGHIGLEPDVLLEMRNHGVDTANLERSVETFIRVWERGLSPSRTGPLPVDDMDTSGVLP